MHLAKAAAQHHVYVAGANRALLSCRDVAHASFCVASAAGGPVPALPAPFSELRMNKDQATIVIAGAARTPVGSFNGALASLPAHELGKVAIQETLKRAGVEGAHVSEVILGQILTAGQ